MSKRIVLFILTNLLVVATLSIIINLLGIKPYLTAQGLNYQSLMIFCLIYGMGGSFISLLLSKFIAIRAMGVQVIDPNKASSIERELLQKVYSLAARAGLSKNPAVGIYNSPEINAFATGPSRNNALVAVSSGLLNSMNNQEIDGVLGHEISHIANGDMVTMTLLQGIVNAFALFLARILAYFISQAFSRSDDNEGGVVSTGAYFLISMVLDIVFTLLGSIVVAAFSRHREYRADAGGAKLAGNDNMISALKRLQAGVATEDPRGVSLDTLKISHKGSWLALFSSHPPLEQRIERLQAKA